MGRVFDAMTIFIAYPYLAAIIGVLFFALGRWTRRRLVIGVGSLWLLYGVYETGIRHHWPWLCSGECNIRVDLLLIYPVLLLGLLVAGWSLWRAGRERRLSG